MADMTQQLSELKEFKDKASIFLNMDYIKMTTDATTMDDFLRTKMSSFQASVTAQILDSA